VAIEQLTLQAALSYSLDSMWCHNPSPMPASLLPGCPSRQRGMRGLQAQRDAVACCVGDPVRVRPARRGDACLFAPADARDAITVAASDLAHKFDGAAAGQSDAVYPARGPTMGAVCR